MSQRHKEKLEEQLEFLEDQQQALRKHPMVVTYLVNEAAQIELEQYLNDQVDDDDEYDGQLELEFDD